VPVEVAPGDEVIGATINAHGRLIVRATRVGADTQLAQIARLVEDAQSGKAPVQRLADRISAVFVPIVIGLAVLTLAVWLLVTGDAQRSFSAAVAVLIIACPCALGLATPTALLVGTGRGAQLGLLIKGPEVLESTRRVDTIVLDKTGTVTTGAMTLADVLPAPDQNRHDVLRIAGALEARASIPSPARSRAPPGSEVGELPKVEQFATRAGIGAGGVVDGRHYDIGRPTGAIDDHTGSTVVELSAGGEVLARFVIADRVKPTSAACDRSSAPARPRASPAHR
jgi:Cu+-exporting ATPase